MQVEHRRPRFQKKLTLEDMTAEQRRAEYHPQDRNHQDSHVSKPLIITAKSANQAAYLAKLENPAHSIVVAVGPAGSGKTMLATQVGIRGLITGEYQKLVLTRPAVSVDESHGFLPGTLERKLEPWLLPILDILQEHYSVRQVQDMIRNKVIMIEPLAFMRGRTFKNSFIIGDEMQNSLPSQLKMLLTRIGEGSRMVITGDLRQHDRTREVNGLVDFMDKLAVQPKASIAVSRFDVADIQRHAVITDILSVYGEVD